MFVIPNIDDMYLFGRGELFEAYRIFGAHLRLYEDIQGVQFTVYAPHAVSVRVVGDFNNWHLQAHPMEPIEENGVWTCFVSGVQVGDIYKYAIETQPACFIYKADPFAFHGQVRPETASRVYDLNAYDWQDGPYLEARPSSYEDLPMNIYEMHLGSWDQHEDGSFFTYKELAESLPAYLVEMAYTHVEFMPLMEHPFDGSWGYQVTGFYAATSRYGPPKDLMYLIDTLHGVGIGVIMDWVPVHFCKDEHGLRLFDGQPVYEYADPTRADQSNWGTSSFDLAKNQVQSFLISNAIYWLDVFHIDGLRVDAVASMLYLDFERQEANWTPNPYGGRENLEGIAFLKKLNSVVQARKPKAIMIAEESSAWAKVTSPVEDGGLGFDFKWNMGWMNDSLRYIETDPAYRKYHHQYLTFSLSYAFSEHFILPISHDEVVHGKESLLNKMPGDYWQKFANHRVFLAYMMTHPGKKLLFMGQEYGQFIEWDENRPLDWFLFDYESHASSHAYVRDLNHLYLEEPALWQKDERQGGFVWLDADNQNQSVISYVRYGLSDHLVVLINFTPETYENYCLGVPEDLAYMEIFNSDATKYGGSGVINTTSLKPILEPMHRQPQHVQLRLPPLAMVILKAR